MKIVVFGLSISSSWGNGHATLWRGLLRALAAAGHDVTFFERDTPYYAQHRDLTHGEGYSMVVYPSWLEIAARARRAVDRADVAIVTSYQADAEPASALVLEAPGARVFYDLDTPVTLDLLDRGERVPYVPLGGLGDFDLVLSYTGGPALAALVSRLGARRVAPLYGSVDRAAHHPSERREAWVCALSYLGTYASDRQEGVERLFLDVAEQAPDWRFLLGGPMYPASMRRPANILHLPHVAPPEHPAFYGSSRATLNITRGTMAKMGFCPSGRLFEAAACGVPLVSDTWEGLDQFFEPAREILVARNAAEVVASLSLDDAELASIARRARERTLLEHTAEHRAEELMALVRSLPPRSAAA